MSSNTTSRPPPIGTGAARPGHTRMKENTGNSLHPSNIPQASLTFLDLRAVRRVGDAETLYALRTERLEKFGHLINLFERETQQTRGISAFVATQRTARAKAAQRINAENSRSGTDIAKILENDEKLAQMAKANAEMDIKYAQKIAQGPEDAAKLAKYKAYLLIEHDEVPDLEEA